MVCVSISSYRHIPNDHKHFVGLTLGVFGTFFLSLILRNNAFSIQKKLFTKENLSEKRKDLVQTVNPETSIHEICLKVQSKDAAITTLLATTSYVTSKV